MSLRISFKVRPRLGVFIAAIVIWGLWAPWVWGAITPERVLVVANRRSETSRTLARYYLQVRHVPRENLVYLDLTPQEEISRYVYVKKIERPLAAYIRRHHLEDRILVLLLMPGVPHKIRGRVARDGDAAAVDSELTLLYRTMLYGPHRLSGWLPNPFFRAPLNIPFEHDRFDIYLVTRIAAYTPLQAKALIDRALKAAQTKPPFTLVLDAKAGPDHPGDNWLYATYLELKNFPGLSLETSFDPAFLVNGKRVIGYASWGSNDPNYPPDRRLHFSFLPGAIGVTYVSTSARTFHAPPANWKVGPWRERWRFFAGSPQSLIADLIAQGITGISGNTYEPYLSASARPYLLFPAYLKGDSLAEAYYRALAYLSWQTVVIGDPLCRLGSPKPSATPPPKGDWFLRRKQAFTQAKARKGPQDRLFLAQIYLEQGLNLKALEEVKPLLKAPQPPQELYPLLLAIAQEKMAAARIRRLLDRREDFKTLLLKGFLALRQEDLPGLKHTLDRLKKAPQGRRSFEVFYLEGLYYLKTGQGAQALPIFERLLAARPEKRFLFLPLLKALKEAGEKERVAHIKEKLLQDPRFVELWPELRNL